MRLLAQQFVAGTVLIEDTSAGIQLAQELRLEGFAHINPVKVKGDKIMRMAAQTPMIEAGRVFIPNDAPWLDDYLHELAMFPKGRFDDQVDSTAQALGYIGMPTSFDNAMEWLRLQIERDAGADSEYHTVIFDHPDPGFGVRSSNGRTILRSRDGFYHCDQGEWDSIRGTRGIVLIAGDIAPR